jgi:hypothetical protein
MSEPLGINDVNRVLHNHFMDVVLKDPTNPLRDRDPAQEWIDEIDEIIDELVQRR